MDERLSNIFLRNGKSAMEYVLCLHQGVRQIATEAIFECLRLGYPLNNGDYEQGTRAAAQTCEGERLIGISRTEGTFVPKEKWGLFGVNFLYFISPYHRLFKDVNAI